MWALASNTKCTKPLHHISINPYKDERLKDAQLLKIVERCEEKYGYKPGEHQRVIVEHIKDGRQHFHVIWNRVSMETGRAVWPGHHWLKSKQVAREMEKELGLKAPGPRKPRQRSTPKRESQITPKLSDGKKRSFDPALKESDPMTAPVSSVAHRSEELINRPVTGRKATTIETTDGPYRPVQGSQSMKAASSGMSPEQWADFVAACDGKITWKLYFQKWGNRGPSI